MNSPALTLRDLFRAAFPGSMTWVSNVPDAHANIHWVVSSIADAQPGDVLLLNTLDLAPQEIGPVLAQAQQQGVAAVLFLGEAHLPDGSLPGGLAVAVALGEYDFFDAQRSLLTLLINQRAALMERGVGIHVQLSQLAAEGQGLAGLATAMAELSGRGIVVQDKRLSLLAERLPVTLELDWENVLRRLAGFDILPEMFRDRKQAASQPVTLEQDLGEGVNRLVAPIIVGGIARGYLSVIGPSGSLSILDSLVAEQGALVCAVEMARTKAVREAEKRLKGDLLTALLQENLSPRDAELWAQGMDLDLTQAHTALRFSWGGTPPPSRRRLETIINGELARKGMRAIISPMSAEIVCFCETPAGTDRPEVAIALGQSIIDQGTREYPSLPLLCGLGTPAGDLNEWRVSFRQAGQALELARRFRERRPLYFPDLSVYRLLIQIEHSPELGGFQEEILGPLLTNDGGRELIRTLEAYFEHNGNLSQTAESLYIHRNTLIYRMERIASITGLNLDNPETRLAVQLALHIYRMMGHLRA